MALVVRFEEFRLVDIILRIRVVRVGFEKSSVVATHIV